MLRRLFSGCVLSSGNKSFANKRQNDLFSFSRISRSLIGNSQEDIRPRVTRRYWQQDVRFESSLPPQPSPSKGGPVTYVMRTVSFNDTQMYKIVHGGVYLELAEEAGDMIVGKHCNDAGYSGFIPALTKIEKVQFIGSAQLGDIMELEGEVIYTSPRSLRLLVSLYANPIVGNQSRHLITRSWLWYVLVSSSGGSTGQAELLPVPQIQGTDAALQEEGRIEHNINVDDRKRRKEAMTVSKMDWNEDGAQSSFIVPQSFCDWKPFSRGGPIIKLMDELSGYVAIKYVQTVCVTGGMDDVNFYSKVVPGSFVTLTAKPVFTSNSTVDLQCVADVETIADGRVTRERAVEAFFSFVALKKQSTIPVSLRQISPNTAEEKELHERRLKVYVRRKEAAKLKTATA